MSSHHFVKEGQEPALLIIDPISLQLAEPILEWAPLVLALDSALDELLIWGIKIDVCFAQMDNMANVKKKLSGQMPVKICSYSDDDDPIQTIFYFLLSSGQRYVTILQTAPQSLFRTAENFAAQLEVTFLTKDLKWSFAHRGHFEKWIPAQHKLLIRNRSAMTLSDGIIKKENFYETVQDAVIKLSSTEQFWVGEYL